MILSLTEGTSNVFVHGIKKDQRDVPFFDLEVMAVVNGLFAHRSDDTVDVRLDEGVDPLLFIQTLLTQ